MPVIANQHPIFIVGVPRSGTTLLAAMLNAHRRMSCGPETHFFDTLSRQENGEVQIINNWPNGAVEFLYSVSHLGNSLPDIYEIDRASLTACLADVPPSPSSALTVVVEEFMRRNQKVRWVEKTPDHLPHVRAIRKYFPQSPVLRIIRDPRSTALSLRNMPWGRKTWLGALALWEDYDRRSKRFFEEDRLSYSLRYEDLLTEPERELRKICDFIGEEFDPAMLETQKSIKDVNKLNEPWKVMAGASIDLSRASSWKNGLTDEEKRAAKSFLGDALIRYGYEPHEKLGRYVFVSRRSALPMFPEVFNRLVNEGARFWPITRNETPHEVLLLGDPDRDEWFGDTSAERAANVVCIIKQVLFASVAGRPVVHYHGENKLAWRSKCSRLVSAFLSLSRCNKPLTSTGQVGS